MIGKIMHILNIIWKYAKIIIFAKVFLIIFVNFITIIISNDDNNTGTTGISNETKNDIK